MQVVNLDELKRNGALWQGRRGALAADRLLASGWRVLDEVHPHGRRQVDDQRVR